MLNKKLKIDKYLKGLKNYGLYPTLSLLEEYENKELFEECSVILEAIQIQIKTLKEANVIIADDLDFPTHIRQFNDKKYREMFDKFGLDGEVAKANNAEYVKAIKKL